MVNNISGHQAFPALPLLLNATDMRLVYALSRAEQSQSSGEGGYGLNLTGTTWLESNLPLVLPKPGSKSMCP